MSKGGAMKKYLSVVVVVFSLGWAISPALGQNTRFFTELHLGGSFWNKGNGPSYLLGTYVIPGDTLHGSLHGIGYYSAEIKGVFSGRVNVGYNFSSHFSFLFSCEVALPRIDFSKSETIFRKHGCATTYLEPEVTLKASGYLFSPAAGLRFFLYKNRTGLYAETFWGLTYRHIDLRWDPSKLLIPHFSSDPHLRDRTNKAFMKIGMGYRYVLSERISVDANLEWTSTQEDRGAVFFLDTWGLYQTANGAVGVNYAF